MTTVKDLSSGELVSFRKKMIQVYDNNNGLVKAEAGVVLSMIEDELSVRGIESSEEDLSLNKRVAGLLINLKALFQRQPALVTKSN